MNLFSLDRCAQATGMKKQYALVIAAIAPLILATQAFAKDRVQLEFVPETEQISGWQDGVQFLDDPREKSVVRLINVADQLPDKQSTFRLYVLNNADLPVTLRPEDVWIEFGEGYRVAMATYEDLEGRFRRDLKRRQALAALGGALSAASANAYTSGSFDYSGTTAYGTHYSGTGTYTAYDPILAKQQQEQAAAQTNAIFRSIQMRQTEGQAALNGLLRTTTIQPGQVHGSIFAYDPPRALKKLPRSSKVTVVVKVGDTEHRIEALLSNQ